MIITNVRTEHYRWPKAHPISNGKHTYTHNELHLLILETDEGITGYGCSWAIEFAEQMAPAILGQDPLNIERLWHRIYVPKFIGRRGTSCKTVSAIDMALWDIKAKVCGLPLCRLLGGYRKRIPCYVAGGYYGPDKGIRELQQEMETYLSWGVRAIKMKVGGLDAREDAQRVQAVREVIGPDVKLLLDANCAYRFFEAVDFAKRVEEFSPYWLEEPVDADDYDGYRKVAQHTVIPLAAGENEVTRFGFRDLVNTRAVAVLNPDAASMGGVTEFLKVAAYADANGLVLSPHGQQQVHIHLNCAVSNSILAEFYPPQYDPMVFDAFRDPVIFHDDGTVSPGTAPGAGLEPNVEFLKPYRVG